MGRQQPCFIRGSMARPRSIDRAWRSLVMAAIGWLLAGASTAQATPNPVALELPPRLTEVDMPVTQDRDLLRVFLDHRRRIYIGGYLASDDRDPRWDAEAVKLAEALAHTTTAYFFSVNERPDEIQTFDLDTREDEAQALIDLGAHGPIINYMLAWAFDGRTDKEKTAKYARMNGPDFLADETFHPLVRFWMARRQARVIPEEVGPDFWRTISTAAAQATVGPFVHPAERRDVYRAIWTECFEDQSFEVRQKFIELLRAQPGADPWLTAALEGGHARETAWDRRGRGYASEVDAVGWTGFEENLVVAREALIQATELQPDFPEPYSALIQVAMGGEVQGDESPRYWFDRATAAQPDWFPALRRMMWALRPRWGGSHQEMLDLGLERLALNRFDTDIPGSFWYALEQIERDEKDPDRRIWLDPKVQDGLDRYFDGLVEAAPLRGHPEFIPFYRTRQAATAYLGRRYAKTEELLDALGKDFDRRGWFGQKLQPRYFVRPELAALEGPFGPALSRIDQLIEAGDLDATLAALDELEADPDPDVPVAAIYRRRFRALAAAKLGKRSAIKLDSPLNGWPLRDAVGKWFLTEDGEINGTNTIKPIYGEVVLHTEGLFDRRTDMDMTGSVTLTPPRGRAKPNAAIIFGHHYNRQGAMQYWTITFRRNPERPESSRVAVNELFHLQSYDATVEVPMQFSFRVSLRFDRVSVWMDDQLVIDRQEVPRYRQFWDRPRYAWGVGFRAAQIGQNVVFRDVVIYPGGILTPREKRKKRWPPYRHRTVF